jgi:hypothetical protein
MEVKQTLIEKLTWNAGSGQFVATGEAMTTDTTTLEKTADRLRVPPGRFLMGPVPWPWIIVAADLPGNALLIGLCLWRLAGAMKCKTVWLGNADLTPLGIDRSSKSRALRALEGAGLIEVVRERGRFPKVTLREMPAPQSVTSDAGVNRSRSISTRASITEGLSHTLLPEIESELRKIEKQDLVK